MGWFFGFKLHLICNEKGELLNFLIIPHTPISHSKRIPMGVRYHTFCNAKADVLGGKT